MNFFQNLWYGIKIRERIEIKDISIIVGDKAIIILPKNLKESLNFLEFYIIVKHYWKLEFTEKSFGIFLDIELNIRRQKIKEDFIENLDESGLIYLIEQRNEESYYVKEMVSEEFVGLDIRFKKNTNDWFSREAEFSKISKEIKEKKAEIFEKF